MWQGFFDYLKNCGRNAGWFMTGILPLMLAAMFWDEGGNYALAVGGIVFVIWTAISFLEMRRDQPRLGRLPPLAQVDWRRARTRLVHSARRRGSVRPLSR